MAGLARRWWVWGLFLLLLPVALWWAAGRFVPGLLRDQAKGWVRDELGLELSVGAVRFEPLKLAVEVENLALPAGAPMVAARRVAVDLSARSLWSGSWVIESLLIDSPRIEAELDREGRLNLARLVPPDDGEPPPALKIADLRVAGGQIGFRDLRRGPDAAVRLVPLDLALSDLHTRRDEGGRFQLKALTASGEALGWTGTLSLAPLASTGGIVFQNLDGARLGVFVGDLLPSKIRGGRADLTIPYHATLADGRMDVILLRPDVTVRGLDVLARPDVLNAEVTAGSLRLRADRLSFTQAPGRALSWSIAVPEAVASDVRVMGTGPASGEGVTAATVTAAGISAGSTGDPIRAERLLIDGLDVVLVRGAGGDLGLLRMIPDTSATEESAAGGLPIAIDRIELQGARLQFDERSTPRRGRYTLAPVSATVTGFRSDGATPFDVAMEGRFNGRPLSVAGQVAADGRAADLAVRVAGLPLAAALPYLPDFPALELISGTIGADGRLIAKLPPGQEPSLGFAGVVDVTGFRLRELVRNSDLFRFDKLRMAGFDYRDGALEIAEARFFRPVGQVALLADGQFNYGFLMDEGVSIAEAEARLAARKAPVKKLTRAERRAEKARAEAEKAARATARAQAKPAAEPDLAITIRRVLIDQGRFQFADLVVEPDFRAEVKAVRGTMTGVTNRPGRVAQIDLAGHVVNRFSPVVIRGRMNLFDYAEATDMRLAFRNIDLPVFNPYSGTYAGYAIAKGKLTAELDYKVRNAALEANHHVVIDQLEWGEATESQQKVGLPIRLATSILKDRNGVITIDLPVSGTVDDPEFSIGPLVWKALGQFAGKLVTAPFRALGGLFADKEDAQFVDFAAGSATLPEAAPETLAELGRALAERPALRLDIPAAPGLERDADALAEAALEAALMAGGHKGTAGLAFADLPLDRQHDLMRALYRKRFGEKPDFDDEEGAGKTERRAARVAQMRAELLPLFRPEAAALRGLGEARAMAVRDAVLAVPEVDPARVFLDGNDRLAEKDGKLRMELKLR
ncbi:DUF748 domain-containing protein [Thermaurantiacus sp.]